MLKYFSMLTLGLLLGCQSASRDNTTELMDGFHSYSSSQEIQKLLTAIELKLEIASQDAIPAQDDMPKVSIVDIRVSDYADAGITGSVEFGFFDDQLAGIAFTPDNWELYKPLLDHRFGKDVVVGDVFSTSARTIISIHKDYQDQLYITWKDSELTDRAFARSLKQH